VGSGIYRRTDTECYLVCCQGLGKAIEGRTGTEYYCVCCKCPGEELREELILSVTVLVVRFWGGQI
jgi:hypothetical protein